MRHKLRKDKLNRTSAHREALLANMSVSLIKHEKIQTTLPKAKMLRPHLEKLITKSKDFSVSTIRYLLSRLKDKSAVFKLVFDIALRVKKRNGGYLRIVKNYYRYGDKAPMAYICFVDASISKKDVVASSTNVKVKELSSSRSLSLGNNKQ